MPELPEVETIRIKLEKYLDNHKILGIQINSPKVFAGNPDNIVGAKIVAIRRFAKVLSIDLSNGFSILIHVKLTGQLIYRGSNLKNPPTLSKKVAGGIGGKHTHVILTLDKNSFLYYNDIRKFGWIKILKTSDVEKTGFIGKLGPEPFKDLNIKKFKEILSKSKRPIKIVLMDQEKISGIGNIYANDALLLSKIHPNRSANSLKEEEEKTLYKNILKVLRIGLKAGGASESDFVRPDGTEGKYQQHFIAYDQEGKTCPVCKTGKIKKIRVGGRGTYICPKCQKI